jgi:hypothetical protein
MIGDGTWRVACALLSTVGALLLAAAPAGAVELTSCTNEQLRTELHSGQLPDCRAYEMVTPSYKAGDFARVWAISPDGTRALASSFGAFGGTESNEFQGADGEAAMYLLTRAGSGWAAEPIAPPTAQYPSNRIEAVSPDLGTTLWMLRTPQHPYRTEGELYLRQASGEFVRIGPTQPQQGEEQFAGIAYMDASEALTHVLFSDLSNEEGAFLWPGDTTARSPSATYPSLYEYSGTGNSEPTLVGVSNEGAPPWKAGAKHRNEGAKLVSQCGTELGGPSAYNAVSASGETVFFTALNRQSCESALPSAEAPEVNQVYARVGGTTTVGISLPSSKDCEACNTTTTTEHEGAAFRGASKDGSKVFFTTEQELLPGTQGENLYEYELDPEHPSKCPLRPDGCITLITSGASPPELRGLARISESGTYVYFVAGGVLTAGSNAEGRAPEPEGNNLYCYDTRTGKLLFVGALSGSDEAVWRSVDQLRPAETNDEGEFFVFTSSADLTAGDTSTVAQVFEYDAVTERLKRLSIGQSGYDNNGNTTEAVDAASLGVEPQSFPGGLLAGTQPMKTEASHVLSQDGSRVFFESADALTPQTIAGLPNNVYEWEREGAGSCPAGEGEGCVYLISDGRDDSTTQGGASVRLVGTDESGGDVLFTTADQLIRRDTDTQIDVYDARVEGGFAEPVSRIECSSSACQAPSNLAPPGLAMQTATAAGEAPEQPASGPATHVTKSKQPTRAQKLAAALKRCRADRKRARRSACEAQARRRFGTKGKAAQRKRGGR